MARIRTIKPEFFRHEGLQDVAAKHGAHVMLVFAGLWGHCDKEGRFEWKPRTLKLDILPFLDFEMSEALKSLCEAGFVEQYEVDGKQYGLIPSFNSHQRVGGKEAQESAKYPAPEVKQSGKKSATHAKRRGSNGEAAGKHSPLQEEEGKGRGREEEVSEAPRASPSPPQDYLRDIGDDADGLMPSDPDDPGWPKAVDLRIAACAWNSVAGAVGLAKISALSGERPTHLRTRLKELGSLGEWLSAVNAIRDQPFLFGQNDRKWRANFDWFVKPANFSKVVENTYERSAPNGRA